ncbi:MAG: AraC family transcriptional regulator [Victivallales bacterium]|nr:AraC family transcriptional regulator [Victivallales bacterium]
MTTGWRTMPFHFCCVTCENPSVKKTLLEIAGSEPRRCDFDDFIFIRAGVSHRNSDISGLPNHSLWIHFRMRILGALDLLDFFDIPPVIGKNKQLERLLFELINLPSRLDFFDSVRQQMLGFELVTELLKYGTRNQLSLSWPDDLERLMPVIRLLSDHPAERIPLPQLAQKVNLSPSRFLALFHQVTGCSPSKFRENERFRRACALLQKGECSLAEIADKLGYCDVFHFSRKFKQSSGQSPKFFANSLKLKIPLS